MVRWIAVACLLVCACQRGQKVKPAEGVRRPAAAVIDVHTHFPAEAADRMVRLMDRYGITAVVNLSGGAPGSGLEEQLEAAARHPGRIFVFMNLDWDLAESGPGYAARMVAELRRGKRLGAVGLKIFKGLGLGYRDYLGGLIAVDDPELDPVFEEAGRLGMPVAIHVGDPVAFWQPPTRANERYDELSAHPGWALYGKPVPSWEELFAQLERRIARHPGTTFISVHFGNAPEYPERVAALLDKYPNLYVDTAARVPELGRHDAALMRRLFMAHDDRILFGMDLGAGTDELDLMLGSTGKDPPTWADVDRFFDSTFRWFETSERQIPSPTPIQGRWNVDGIALPAESLRRIYAGNAERLLGLRR